MKPEDVMKALECCTRGRKSNDDMPCLECPYNECNIVGGTSERQTKGTCQGWLMKDALALLREKDAVIERLRKAVDAWAGEAEEARAENVKLTEENDGWKASNKILTTNNADLEDELALTYDLLEESKADTVRKMRSEINKTLSALCKGDVSEIRRMIDQIAKEILEAHE